MILPKTVHLYRIATPKSFTFRPPPIALHSKNAMVPPRHGNRAGAHLHWLPTTRTCWGRKMVGRIGQRVFHPDFDTSGVARHDYVRARSLPDGHLTRAARLGAEDRIQLLGTLGFVAMQIDRGRSD